MPEPILTPEHKLWRAVLEQAHTDAECAPGESEADGSAPKERVRARRFLTAGTLLDFACLRFVCDLAEVPNDRVIRWARERYAAAAG